MAYRELRGYILAYRAGKISRAEMVAAFGLYQRRNHIEVTDARNR